MFLLNLELVKFVADALLKRSRCTAKLELTQLLCLLIRFGLGHRARPNLFLITCIIVFVKANELLDELKDLLVQEIWAFQLASVVTPVALLST